MRQSSSIMGRTLKGKGWRTLTQPHDPIEDMLGAIRHLLCEKLSNRLGLTTEDVPQWSGHTLVDIGTKFAFNDPAFIKRFGAQLCMVSDAEIWDFTEAIQLVPPPLDVVGNRMEELLNKLYQVYQHIQRAPPGLTGLAYFDDWHENREDTREPIHIGHGMAAVLHSWRSERGHSTEIASAMMHLLERYSGLVEGPGEGYLSDIMGALEEKIRERYRSM